MIGIKGPVGEVPEVKTGKLGMAFPRTRFHSTVKFFLKRKEEFIPLVSLALGLVRSDSPVAAYADKNDLAYPKGRWGFSKPPSWTRQER